MKAQFQLTYHYVRDAFKEVVEGVDEADKSGAYITQGRMGDQTDYIEDGATPARPQRTRFQTLALIAAHDKNKLKQKTSKKPKKSRNQSNRDDVVQEDEGRLLEVKAPKSPETVDYIEKPALDLDSQAGLSNATSVV